MAALPLSALALGADLVQPRVDLGVDPADEERRDRGQPGQVAAGGPGPLEAVEERLHDLAVAFQREDQGDVDADALGDALRDRGQPGFGGRDLDEQVRPVDEPPQLPRLGDGCVGLGREAGIDLDGHPAVDAVAGLVNRREHVAGPPHVGGGQHPQCLAGPDAPASEVVQLLVVAVAVGDRLGEDRRVRGDPGHVPVPDEVAQRARRQPQPAQVIEPHGHSGGGQGSQAVSHDARPRSDAGHRSARRTPRESSRRHATARAPRT